MLGAGPARVMREATELIAQSLDGGARFISNRVDGFAGVTHNAGRGAEKVDGIGAEVINGYSFDISDNQGNSHHIHDIRVNPLVDHNGNIFGISFPTVKGEPGKQHSDEEAYSIWSRMPDRLGDSQYYPERRVDPGDGSEPSWEDAGPSQPAPWARDAEDGMLFVHAHADENGFRIEANFGTDADPNWQMLGLSGSMFGQLVVANTDFQAASRAGPDKPLMMLACKAGDPVYAHAERAAEVIHSAGMNHDVWATVGINTARWNEKEGTAEVGVEIPDNTAPADAITVIRAPNRTPAA